MSTARVLSRPVPPEWAARLAEVSPKQEGLAHLHLVWVAGETPEIDGVTYNRPVERWVLYQIQPARFIPPETLAELQGPHPRSTGMWRPYRRADGTMGARWLGGPCGRVTREQWELYRETGGLAEAWWVIQGDKGGHRVALTPPEKALYAAEWGCDPQQVVVPRMGALPYAPFDERVLDAIQQHDTLALFANMTGLGSRYGELLMRHHAALEAQARVKTYDGVYSAMADEMADELHHALHKADPAWRPVVSDVKDTFDADYARESFVEGTDSFAEGGVRTIHHQGSAAKLAH